MNVLTQFIISACILLSAFTTFAKPLSQCLGETQNQHRIERDQNILACFKMQKAFIGSDECFKQVRKLKAASQSQNLSEQLKSICFYEASIFQNVNLCLNRADEFKNADNHDEAVFDCFKQFQDKIGKKACEKISERLTYPAKKDYLYQHCQNL